MRGNWTSGIRESTAKASPVLPAPVGDHAYPALQNGFALTPEGAFGHTLPARQEAKGAERKRGCSPATFQKA